jgi:hypothetical protein
MGFNSAFKGLMIRAGWLGSAIDISELLCHYITLPGLVCGYSGKY